MMRFDPNIDYKVVIADERFLAMPASVRKIVHKWVAFQAQKIKPVTGAAKTDKRRKAKLAKASRKRNRK